MKLESKDNIYSARVSSDEYLEIFFPGIIAKIENLISICDYSLNNPPSKSVIKSLREEFITLNYQVNSTGRAYNLLNPSNWLI